MELVRELRSGIDKYIEATGRQPTLIRLTQKSFDELFEGNPYDSRIYPHFSVVFDGIPVQPIGPEAPSNLAFLLE